jgi:hypothetical protein
MRKNKNARKRGQTSVEYILIIAAIVGIIVLFGEKFKNKIGDVTESLFSSIGSGINRMGASGN